jgi:hypothetical protein
VCQIHTAVSAVIRSLWLDDQAADAIYTQAAAEIQWAQHRNAQARKSHTKTTRRRLRQLGIQLSSLKRCVWNSS